MSFKHLNKLAVTEELRAKITLYDIENPDGTFPVLEVAPAGQSHKAYFNALLRRSKRNMPQIQAQAFDSAMIEDNRAQDKTLYSKHILKGWTDVKDDKGKDVVFTEEQGLGFLEALPPWIFDKVRVFCTKAENFIDQPTPDVEGTSGNSQRG